MPDEKRSPGGPSLDVPDLDVPRARPPAPAPAAAAAPPPADDDDPLGMEIQRDMSQPFAAPPPASAKRAAGGVALDDGPRAARGSGLDVSHNRLAPRAAEGPTGPSMLAKVLGPTGALVLGGGAVAGLLRLAHRPAGLSLTALQPSAFDGSSAVASGAVALSSLVGAIALGYLGLRSPRSWWLVGSAALVMLLALAMVTVTLASSGEHGPPPDGALLVPWLAPLATLLAGIDLVRRGARRLVEAEGSARALGAPVALAGGALVFLAVETSRFANLLPRL